MRFSTVKMKSRAITGPGLCRTRKGGNGEGKRGVQKRGRGRNSRSALRESVTFPSLKPLVSSFPVPFSSVYPPLRNPGGFSAPLSSPFPSKTPVIPTRLQPKLLTGISPNPPIFYPSTANFFSSYPNKFEASSASRRHASPFSSPSNTAAGFLITYAINPIT